MFSDSTRRAVIALVAADFGATDEERRAVMNALDGMEGARYKNVFCTYSHGCLLPKNPILADHILKTALTRKYGSAELAPLDDAVETAAHSYMERRLTAK